MLLKLLYHERRVVREVWKERKRKPLLSCLILTPAGQFETCVEFSIILGNIDTYHKSKQIPAYLKIITTLHLQNCWYAYFVSPRKVKNTLWTWCQGCEERESKSSIITAGGERCGVLTFGRGGERSSPTAIKCDFDRGIYRWRKKDRETAHKLFRLKIDFFFCRISFVLKKKVINLHFVFKDIHIILSINIKSLTTLPECIFYC